MTALHRSKVYQNLYPDDLMMSAFGTLTPDASTRTAYFFDLWLKRRHNRSFVAREQIKQASTQLAQFQLTNPWDFQIKHNEIRFERAEDLAMFKIAWRTQHEQTRI